MTIDVIGPIWWPSGAMAATTYNVTNYDVENMRDESGHLTHDSVALWLDAHSGDFQHVTDFSAHLGETDIDWQDDESEFVWADSMYPEES